MRNFRLVAGEAPRPLGRGLSVTDVPDDLILRALAATQRETLLTGLALSFADAPTDALRAALHRVASEANALALKEVLEVMARRGSLGFCVEALGLEWLLALGKQRGVAINDVLATSDTVSRRGLTTSEARRIVENFAHTLDPDTVRFCFTTGVQTMGAGAMVVGNTIHVDPGDPRWQIARGTTLPEHPDDEAWESFNGVLLAHEPTHVWSYQHQGSRYAVNSVVEQLAALKTGDRGGAYFYRPDRAHFLEYGEEQRAMLVQDYIAAERGKRTGQTTSLTLYGGTLPIDDVLETLRKYVEQMRAMGPGVAEPVGRQPEWILCACVTRGFVQDGGAGLVGAQGSAWLAAAGRGATEAVTQGLAHRDVGQVALGVAGVTAAVAASVLPREQGGASGGSAMLDQTGVPRGVQLEKGGVAVSAKAAWDAPDQLGTVKDPRVEWEASVHRDGVDAKANAVVATSGVVKSTSGSVRVEKDGTTLGFSAGTAAQKQWARVEFLSDPVSVAVGGSVAPRAVSVDARVETKRLEVDTAAQFTRTGDTPLALSAAEVNASTQLSPGVTLGVGTKLVPDGVDGLSAQLAAVGDAGSVSVTASGTHLTTQPTLGLAVTATEKKSGVAVSAHAQTTPTTGEVEGGVTVSVPLPK